jgi:hypothetical protein
LCLLELALRVRSPTELMKNSKKKKKEKNRRNIRKSSGFNLIREGRPKFIFHHIYSIYLLFFLFFCPGHKFHVCFILTLVISVCQSSKQLQCCERFHIYKYIPIERERDRVWIETRYIRSPIPTTADGWILFFFFFLSFWRHHTNSLSVSVCLHLFMCVYRRSAPITINIVLSCRRKMGGRLSFLSSTVWQSTSFFSFSLNFILFFF